MSRGRNEEAIWYIKCVTCLATSYVHSLYPTSLHKCATHWFENKLLTLALRKEYVRVQSAYVYEDEEEVVCFSTHWVYIDIHSISWQPGISNQSKGNKRILLG